MSRGSRPGGRSLRSASGLGGLTILGGGGSRGCALRPEAKALVTFCSALWLSARPARGMGRNMAQYWGAPRSRIASMDCWITGSTSLSRSLVVTPAWASSFLKGRTWVSCFRTRFCCCTVLFTAKKRSSLWVQRFPILPLLKPLPPQSLASAAMAMSTTVLMSYREPRTPRMRFLTSSADWHAMSSTLLERITPKARSMRYARAWGCAFGSVDCANRMSQKRNTLAVGMNVA
mmetsp:Transcript_77602/g.219455  ORF Transcript_77602/g.219455 Transcript_77602/m.219455 type:complete len:232 (+) Transcript_77602:1680-2375(+)